MPEPAQESSGTAVYRTPIFAIESCLRAIVSLAPGIEDEDAAWEAFIAQKRPEDRAYVRAIRSSGHSCFYHLLHELYILGAKLTGRPEQEFTAECGLEFMKRFFQENVFAFLQVALANPGEFQSTIVDIIRMYTYRYTGPKFMVTDEIRTDEIVFTLRYANQAEAIAYLERHGLEGPRSFRNTLSYFGAVYDQFLAYIVEGYAVRSVSTTASGYEGAIHLPVKESDRIEHGVLIGPLTGYVQELARRKEQASEDERLENDLIVGSDAMRQTWERIRRASRSGQIVLLRGESGTGKSFIARKIHELSDRRKRPLIEVGLTSDIGSDNMVQSDLFGHEKGAFTGAGGQKEGLFSLADGGTIFLDEIGDASPEVQAKLLRVIESSTFKRLGAGGDIKVDVRVIVATNRDLEKMVEEGTFRKDLYYRLNVIPIELPPLRERPEDVPALAEFLVARAARSDPAMRKDLAPGLADELRAYPWPGNVRELDHALKYAAAMAEGPEIGRDDLPETVRIPLEKASAKGGAEAATSAARDGAPDGPSGRQEIVDEEALRSAIRSGDPASMAGASNTHEIPGHVDHVRRLHLGTLIDEFGGDLSLIGKFWDRGSEKTLRRLIKQYGLAERFEAARARPRRPT
jgi:DNA-binding NtrC family response regulator